LTKGLMVFQTPLGAAAACCLASAISSVRGLPARSGRAGSGAGDGDGDASEEGRWWRSPRSLVPLRFLLLQKATRAGADNRLLLRINNKW
jgi:hypothetical protein